MRDFVAAVFSELDLDWKNYVEIDRKLYRPSDIMCSRGDLAKARLQLEWQPRHTMPDVVRLMVQDELRQQSESLEA